MADLAIGVSKTTLDRLVNKVKDAIKEEEAQWQIVERDLVFITGEFEMMQSFLLSADGDRVRNNRVVRTWVQQVRDLSYDMEDCIDFVLQLDSGRRAWWLRLVPSWARPRAALPVDEAVAEITQLKARVMDISQRNTRYSLISDESGSKPAAPTTSSSTFGVLKVGTSPNKNSGLSDMLNKAMNWEHKPLQVISVAGATRFDIGRTSVIRKLYDEGTTSGIFKRRAWVKLTDPFDPHEFIRSLVAQFLTDPCDDALMKLEEIQGSNNLVKEFAQEVKTHRYLIVLDDVSSMEQWYAINRYLPDKNNGSRVIVSTHHAEIAILCTGKPYRVSVLQQSSTDQPYHVFHKERTGGEERSGRKRRVAVRPLETGLIGRDVDVDELLELIQAHRHVSVWGPPGVGKTALVKSVNDKSTGFERQCWANLSHPFNGEGLARDLLSGLRGRKRRMVSDDDSRVDNGDPVCRCQNTFRDRSLKSLVVIDGLRSKGEWDWIKANLTGGAADGCRFICVTADERIATYCAQTSDDGAVYRVKRLDDAAARRLFMERQLLQYSGINVSSLRKKAQVQTDEEVRHTLSKGSRHILSKCAGLPKFIVTLADYLGKQSTQRRDTEIRLLNDNFMHQLENNPEFHCLLDLCPSLGSKFDASSQILKKCIFYLSIFPRDSSIRRKRLVRRWVAEGYAKGRSGGFEEQAEKQGEKLIEKLVDLWIIQPQKTITVSGAMRMTCEVNSFFLEHIISREAEEKTFLPLEVCVLDKRYRLTTERVGQHLAIQSSWVRDEFVYRSLDLSRLRSLTVSGEWQPFFIPEKMRVLRVLDLEGTTNLRDGDLDKIGELVPRLKFLSLRGCGPISCLPESVGDLSHLETLDIRHTSIPKLPKTINRLKKLQYIRAGKMQFFADMDHPAAAAPTMRRRRRGCRTLMRNPLMHNLTLHLRASYSFSTKQQAWSNSGGAARRGVVVDGVGLPPAMGRNLQASLHTLGVVDGNSAGGRFLLFQLRQKLPQLRKLAVCGLHGDDVPDLLHAISRHDNLESLSLKIDRLLWFSRLPSSLLKLSLDVTGVLKQASVDALMAHEKLRTLRLRVNTAEDGDGQPVVQFFPGKMAKERWIQGRFDKLKVLEIACSSRLHVKFSQEAMQELELLRVHCSELGWPPEVSGLQDLKALKHVCLVGSYDDTLREALQKQLDEHQKKPKLHALEMGGEQASSSSRYGDLY